MFAQSTRSMHTSRGINNTTPRAFIRHGLHLAPAAEITSVYVLLPKLWIISLFMLRRNVPSPTKDFVQGQSLEQVDEKVSLWETLVDRSQQRSSKDCIMSLTNIHSSNLIRKDSGTAILLAPLRVTMEGRHKPGWQLGDQDHSVFG